MSWVAGQSRWTKQYRGKTYSVSCRQLSATPSKEASAAQANAWWEQKQAELTARSCPVIEKAITSHRDVLRWFDTHNAKDSDQSFRELMAGRLEKLVKTKEAGGSYLETGLSRSVLLQPAFEFLDDGIYENMGKDAVWLDRLTTLPNVPTEPEVLTVGKAVENFFAQRRKMSPGRKEFVRTCMKYFAGWIGETLPVRSINAARLEDYQTHLLNLIEDGEISQSYANGRMRVAKQLVTWLWEREECEQPRNFRKLCISISRKEIEVFEVEELRALVGRADGEKKLWLLLMANCGFTQRDISELRQVEVDWSKGRIKRRRSKTGDMENCPVVDYKLWPETLRLLQAHRSKDAQRVLLNRRGEPLWWEAHQDGKFKHRDDIGATLRKLKIGKPPKLIRKTSASLLETHAEFGRYAQFFLGHSPKSVTEDRYARPSIDRFDTALTWLGETYGF